MDLDRITHPLRLACGSHEAGSGKGCAMNVVSWMKGDVRITDFPDCSSRYLARLVQMCNDVLACRGEDNLLTPQDSLMALDLAWRTVGTRGMLHPSRMPVWLSEVNAGLTPFQIQIIRDGRMIPTGDGDATIDPRMVDPLIDVVRVAINRWRELANLDAPEDVSVEEINSALGKMLCTPM
jgi:hypothetical protein